MSTDYTTAPPVRFADLFDGRLEKRGVREKNSRRHHRDRRFREERDAVPSASCREGGYFLFRPRASRIPADVIDALTKEFEVDFVNEHEPRYWGFETEEEWFADEEKLSRERGDRLYGRLLPYLHGMSVALSGKPI
jgi:hypothetical protein